MDLQAILDAPSSDSSDGGEITIDGLLSRRGGRSSSGMSDPRSRCGGSVISHSAPSEVGKGRNPPVVAKRVPVSDNPELERILRDAEEEDQNDDEYDGGAGREYDDNERREHGAGGPGYLPARASGGDRLLQSILDEDSDSDDGGDFGVDKFRSGSGSRRSVSGSSVGDVMRPSSYLGANGRGRGHAADLPMSHSMEVEAILNSQDAGDSDDGYADGFPRAGRSSSDAIRRMVSGISLQNTDDSDDGDESDVGFNFNFTSSISHLAPAGEENMDGQFPLREDSGPSPWAVERDASADGLSPAQNGRPREDSGELKDDGPPAGLRAAVANEQSLLSSRTNRSIVSPLGVKRRMKVPRVELKTKSRERGGDRGTTAAVASASASAPRFGMSNGVIRCRSMSGLGSQLLVQEAGARGAGLPTSLAVGTKFIAVGNQHGVVLVFDLYEQLKTVLGGDGDSGGAGTGNSPMRRAASSSSGDGAAGYGGAVTSIDLAGRGDLLIAGYGGGTVVLWDIIKSTPLKVIDDMHRSSIACVRLTSGSGGSDYQYGGSDQGGSSGSVGAVTVDASGLVNKLVFTRGRLWSSAYSVESECLLDGTAGQILAMDALPPLDSSTHDGSGDDSAHHPSARRIALIALSSSRSSFAVSVEPRVSVLHKWARPSMDRIDPSSAPEDDDGRMTTVSSHYASTYASSYLSTSTYRVGGGSAVSSATASEPSLPYLPCLSWGWALVSGGGGSVTPILARAWGQSLQLLRAAYPPFDPDADDGEGGAVHWPAFGVHDELETESPVVALSWLGKRSLVYLTLANEFAVVDTVIMTMQERLDFSGMSLVYAEFSLSRGAGASPRRPEACTTFMNSMRSCDTRLLVLCRGEVKQVTILGMKQQIMSLEEGGQWLEALALALDHYESTVASQEDKQRTSSSSSAGHVSSMDPSMLTEDEIWMAELLMRYLILAIENAPESLPYVSRNGMDLAHSHFEMLSGVCVEFCTTTKRLDLLFGPIFRCFYDARYINVFLDVMEAYVLNDRLRYIAPEAMSLFVAHCREMKDLSTVERCLLHMDCSLMDFHSILSLLKKHSLFTGLFHVYTSGLDDFVSPLEVLMEALFGAVDADLANELSRDGLGGTKAELYGYKALLYLQYCFEGKSFPKGDPLQNEDRLQTLRPELFGLLLQKAYSNQRGHRGSSYPPRGIRALSYPYLRALAMVDAKLLFGCISNVFDDQDARFLPSTDLIADSWQVEIGTDTSFDVERIDNHSNDDKTFLPSKQSIIGCLSSVIMKESLVDPSSQMGSRKLMTLLSIKAKHAYLDFLATVLANGAVRTPKYIGEVFVRLTNKKGSSEDEILTLLHALPRGSFELDEILFTVERVDMLRAALFLHQEAVRANLSSEITARKAQHHLDKCIDCFLVDRDADFRLGVFDYIRKTSSTGDVSGVLRDVIFKRLAELIDLDPNQAALLVAEVISDEIGTVLYRLKGLKSGSIEFKLLEAVVSSNSNDDSALQLKSTLTTEHHHSYLELLIKFKPEEVYQYLQTHQNKYRLDDALKQCQDCEIADASAYLLERLGDISGSLKLMLESLDERLRNLKLALQSNFGSMRSRTRNVSVCIQQNESLVKEVNRIKQILSAVLDLCERNKNDHLTLDNESGPLLWFHVLDKLVGTKATLGVALESKDSVALGISSVLSEMLLMTMQRMITNVPLIDLMKKITNDYSGSALGEFREMLVSMLTTYRSELGICSNAVDVMLHDIRQLSYKRKSAKVKGIFVHEGASLSTVRAAVVEINPTGGKLLSPVLENEYGLSSFGTSQTVVDQPALLQRRLNGRRARLHHRGNNKRRRGGNNLSLVTVSEFSVAPFEEGRVVAGNLSDAQHIGGL